MKEKKILIRCAAIVFIGFLLWSIFHRNYQEVLELIMQIPINLFVIILGVGLLYQLAEAVICLVFVKRYLETFSFLSAVQLVFIGFFTNIASMGTGIIPAKSYYLYKRGMPTGHGISVMTYEYIFHRTSVLIWVLFLLPVINNIMRTDHIGIHWWLILGIVITAGINTLLILLCTWEKFRSFSFYILEKIPLNEKWKEKKKTWKEQINGLYSESKSVIKDKKLIIEMLALNMVKLAILYLIPWLSLFAIGEGTSCTFGKSFVLAAVMLLVTSVIPNVAGMGPAEYMFIFVYGFYTTHASAASAMLLYRAATYFFPFLISIVAVMFAKRMDAMKGGASMQKRTKKIVKKYALLKK